MATHGDFADYVVDQLGEAGVVRSRKMFGEYGLFCDGTFFAVLCGDQLFVKITPQGEAAWPGLPKVPPYEGAREYSLAEEVDDRAKLGLLASATCVPLRTRPPHTRRR